MEATFKKTWKQSRIPSLIVVGLMYFVAISLGVLAFALLPQAWSFVIKIFAADFVMTLVIFAFSALKPFLGSMSLLSLPSVFGEPD